MSHEAHPPLSIIIPTLNAGAGLDASLDAIEKDALAFPYKIFVVDGGSTDSTLEKACARNVDIINSEAGRGHQLASGAERATGDWLLFLHADTRLSPGWSTEVKAFTEHTAHTNKAAVFRFRLDDDSPAAKRLEGMVNWRNRRLGLPYGDQGLLIHRAFYQKLQGHAAIALMEDVDIIRRIGQHQLHFLQAEAITSADKFRRDGYLLRPLKNLFCLALYFAGLPPRLIARIYQ